MYDVYRVLRILHPSAHCITLQLIAGGRAAVYVLTPKSDLIFLLLCSCVLYIVIADNIYVGFRVLYYIGCYASVFLCFVLFCDLCVLAFVLYCVICVLVICIVSCIVIAGAHTQIRPCLCVWHMITGVGVHTCLWPTTARLLCLKISLNISSLYCDQLEYIEHILWSAWIWSGGYPWGSSGIGCQKLWKDVELHTAGASFMVVPWRNIPKRGNLTISRFPWQSESSLQDLQAQHSISARSLQSSLLDFWFGRQSMLEGVGTLVHLYNWTFRL